MKFFNGFNFLDKGYLSKHDVYMSTTILPYVEVISF